LITDKLTYSPLIRGASNIALDVFNKTSFPTRKDEQWKYSPLKKLKKPPFTNNSSFSIRNISTLNLPQMDGLIVVLENGRINTNLSELPKINGLELSFLSTSKENDNHIINSKKENYFSLLNSSYLSEGITIKVGSGVKVQQNINILNIVSSNDSLVNTKLDLILSDNSSIHIRQYFLAYKKTINGFINHNNNFLVHNNATLVLDKFQDLNNNFHISNDCIDQEESSTFISNTFSMSGLLTRNDVLNNVNGENCHSELNGIFTPFKNDHIDNHTTINHHVPNCKSYENYKGIMKENGVGVFNGKVIVHENAQKIEAFQQNNNILLDDEATIYSKPELEIYADDVKCSHGSTTGQFDQESIFYLRARGLSLKKAKELMILGFINEVIQKSGNSEYVDFILERILEN
jgi:Fe-S cluster assembly protein SufD